MRKQQLLIPGIIVFLLGLNFLLAPYLNRKEATKVVHAVLRLWAEGDIPGAFGYWENQRRTPPVYDVISSTVNKKIFTKKDKVWQAQFFVTLEFPEGNIFPSDREWVFELKTTKLGWKITDFRMVE
jgi:hypothetical protein